MKIFILPGQFYPDLAGSATATYLIATELAKRGHQVTVAVDKNKEALLQNNKFLFNVEYIDSYQAFATGKAGFKETTEQIYKVIKKSDFDIVHIYSYLPMFLFSFIRDLFDFPVIFTFWNTPYKQQRAIGFYKESDLDIQLARSIIQSKKYDRLILGSQCNYDSAIFLGADLKTTDLCYHGINIDEFEDDLAKNSNLDLNIYFDLNLMKQDTLITLPGRIVSRKGIMEAIEALAIVNKMYPIKLLLTGMAEAKDNEFSRLVLQKAKALDVLEKILIPNKIIARNHLPVIYKRSDIVITPSYYEGLGFTAIEALAAARPLIATSVPGLNEVGKHEQNCLLVPAKDSKSLAKAIIRLLSDKALALRLGAVGPESIKKFEMKGFVDFLDETYTNLVKKTK